MNITSKKNIITSSKILIKNVKILDIARQKEFAGEILIEDGKVCEINQAPKKTKVTGEISIIDGQGGYLSPAFIDVGVNVDSASDTALDELNQKAVCAGIGTVVLNSHKHCPLDKPEVIRSIEKYRNRSEGAQILALASFCQDYKGQKMSEVGTLLESGAIAITADPLPENLRLTLQFLRYASSFSSSFAKKGEFKFWANPFDHNFNGAVAEGKYSSKYGLLPIPTLAESSSIAKLIEIIEYQNSQNGQKWQFHLQKISSARSVQLVTNNNGLSASIPLTNLLFTEDEIIGFNSAFRANPPLRTTTDKKALRQAIINSLDNKSATAGKFNIISNHYNFYEEQLKVPFGEVSARGGRLGNMENLLNCVVQISAEEKIPLLKMLKSITTIPAKLIKKTILSEIELKNNANLCLFNLDKNQAKIKLTIADGKIFKF